MAGTAKIPLRNGAANPSKGWVSQRLVAGTHLEQSRGPVLRYWIYTRMNVLPSTLIFSYGRPRA